MEELRHQVTQRLLVLGLEGGGNGGVVEVEYVGAGEKDVWIGVVQTG